MDGTPLYAMHDESTSLAMKTSSSPSLSESAVLTAEPIAGLNFANFNQDYSCISVGYENGFRIYNCEPFTQCYEKIDGSIGIVEMLFCSSLLAIVGTGENASLSPRRLKIINTKRNTTICELTFPTSILAIRMNREILIVLLEEIIYIYDITNMRLLHTVEIPSNPSGLITLSIDTNNNYMAYPSPQKVSKLNPTLTGQGMVDVTAINGQHPSTSSNPLLPASNGAARDDGNGPTNDTHATHSVRNGDIIIFDCKSLQPITVIEAHKTQIAAMAFSHDGTLLATASDKGTIIRVFSVQTGLKLYQFRRGTYNTKIYSLAFSSSNMFLIASSATGTVHIFRLGEEEAKNTIIRSRGSSGWITNKKNDTDRSLEVTRQEEINKLLKSREARLEMNDHFDLNDIAEEDADVAHENTVNEGKARENAQTNLTALPDFDKLTLHSDSEDDVESLSEEDDEQSKDDDDEEEEEEDVDGEVGYNNDGDVGQLAGVSEGDDYEGADALAPLNSDSNANVPSGAVSIFSNTSGGNASLKSQPVVDSNRRSVARMLRRTSQSLGRKAAEKMGVYLPPRFSSILEPNRHFASFKVPTSKENMTIVGVVESLADSTDLPDDVKFPQHVVQALTDDSSSLHSMNSGTSGVSRLLRKQVVNILVVSAEGMFYTYRLDPERGGDCVLTAQRSLVD